MGDSIVVFDEAQYMASFLAVGTEIVANVSLFGLSRSAEAPLPVGHRVFPPARRGLPRLHDERPGAGYRGDS